MAILNTLISWIVQQRVPQIEFFIKNPEHVQYRVLEELCSAAKDTEWGRRYDLKSVYSAESFSQRVPVQTYESLHPLIVRMMQGEQDVLWPGGVKWFAKSSGTTNDKSKYIPVSEESLRRCHFKGGKDLLAMYIHNREDSKLFTGKSLVLSGSSDTTFGGDVRCGDLSAVIVENLPIWVQFYQALEPDVALLPDWEEKLAAICRVTKDANITSLAGIPTWMLIVIKQLLASANATDLSSVWPELEVYFHGAVSFTPYHSQFLRLISSSQMNYVETYNASEGFFGIQDRLESNEMLLMLDYGIFYEFIPMDQFVDDALNHPVIQLADVEINKNYALVITTNAGLWRYLVGDTIIFTSTNPYRIRVSGRTRHFINAFGEELMIDNAEKALAYACRKTDSIISEYTAAPVYFSENSNGCHEWIIEFERLPLEINAFAGFLDEKLKLVNSDYDAKRYQNIALKPPVVIVAEKGTFYTWLKSKRKLGGQHKVPRLSNSRQYLEEILTIIDDRQYAATK